MLIHPWDAAIDTAEWQHWLASTDRFGVLAVNNLDHANAPIVLPLHFTVAGDELLLHLARPNPVWPHLEAAAEVRLAVTGDYAYIPTYWRSAAQRLSMSLGPRPKSSLPSSPTSNRKADTPPLVSIFRPTVACFPASAVSG
jgi:hypothetical protein